MSNLKGSDFRRQCKDAFHKLEAFKTPRLGKNDHYTHSDKLAQKREMYLRDLSQYFQSQNSEIKLNKLFTKENLDKFFDYRLENLAVKTQENYLRGISSMMQGMQQKNVDIPILKEDKSYFDDRVAILKDQVDIVIENRYIDNVDNVIQNLYEDRAVTGLLAQIQYDLSIRQAEAFELLRNHQKYLTNTGIVRGLIGKGNFQYESKEISLSLEQRIIQNQDEIPSKSQYWNDLNRYNISSHDFRFTSARDKYEEKLKMGKSVKQAKLEISRILNHKRLSISDYYLNRTV